MPNYFMFVTDEWSNLDITRPSARAITQAMQEAALGLNIGQWVGPMPRITRYAEIPRGTHTTVAWLFRLGDGVVNIQHALDLMQNNLHTALRRVSRSFTQPTFIAYTPAMNGSLQWWATGLASQTRTQNAPDTGTDRARTRENTIGPDFVPGILGGGAGSGGSSIFGTAIRLGLLGLAGYVTYAIWKTATSEPESGGTDRSGKPFRAGKWLGGLLKDESASSASSSRSRKSSGKTAAKEAAQKEREAKEADRAAKRAAKEADRAARRAEREEEKFGAATTVRIKTRSVRTDPRGRKELGERDTGRLGKQARVKKGKTRRRPSDPPKRAMLELPSQLERATVRA